MNVTVAGDDVTGARIAEALMAEHSVVFLGPEAEIKPLSERLDVQLVFGSITTQHILEEAQLDEADAFIAASSNDERNIVACLAAKRLGAKRSVCILNSQGLFGEEDDVADALGIDVVVRPAEQLAAEITRIVTVPGALDVHEFAGGKVALLRYAVEEGAEITKGPLSQAKLPKNVLLVAIRRDEELILPRGSTRPQTGDRVLAMGRWGAIQGLASVLGTRTDHKRRRAAVIGAGSVGVAVARGLLAAGWRIKLIESDAKRCELVAEELDALVLHGDGADIELLEQEGVDELPVVVAVTNNDEKNLLISLLAKQLGVPRIVTRADKLTNELMFERVGIDVVRSSRGAAIRSVVRSITKPEVEIQAVLEHGEASVIEVMLPHDFKKRRLRDIRSPQEAVIGAILRRRKAIVPGGNDTLQPYDKLLVFCKQGAEEETRQFFVDNTVSKTQAPPPSAVGG